MKFSPKDGVMAESVSEYDSDKILFEILIGYSDYYFQIPNIFSVRTKNSHPLASA